MAVTPNYSWPVPVNTDYVKDGAEAIKDLGDAIDSTVFGLPSGASGLTLVKSQVIGTAVSSVNVTGAFSSTYDSYKIIVNGGVGSTTLSLISLKFGTTTTGYNAAYAGAPYSTGGVSTTTDNNTSSFTRFGTANTDNIISTIEVINPNLLKNTVVTGVQVESSIARIGTGFVNNLLAYTDFTLTPASGTLTGGTIRVYGYQN